MILRKTLFLSIIVLSSTHLLPCERITEPKPMAPTITVSSPREILRNSRALLNAVANNNAHAVQTILGSDAVDVNIMFHHRTPMTWSIFRRQAPITQMLLDDPRTEVNRLDGDGYTPLMEAVNHEDTAITRKLLAHPNIKINKRNQLGIQAIMIAACKENSQTLSILLSNPETHVNRQDTTTGKTPLIMAAMRGNTRNVAALLAHPRIKPDTQDIRGYTAIMLAIKNDYAETVKAFLNAPKRVNLSLRNNAGKSAFDFVIHGSAIEHILQEYLKQSSADSQ